MTYPAPALPGDGSCDVSRSIDEMAALTDGLLALAATGGPQARPDVFRDRFRALARGLGEAVAALSAMAGTAEAGPPRDYTAGYPVSTAPAPQGWEPAQWSAVAAYVGQISHAIEAARNMLQQQRTAHTSLEAEEGMMQAYEVLTLAEEAIMQPGALKIRQVPREFAIGLAAGSGRRSTATLTVSRPAPLDNCSRGRG